MIASVNGDFIPSTGYVTLEVIATGDSCSDTSGSYNPIAITAWTIIQDVGTGFFATEIPTTTSRNDDVTGAVGCLNKTDSRCRGLIPKGNTVIARYDVNDSVGSESLIFVWLTDTGTKSAYLQCADELQISTTIKHKKVNVIDPATLGGIGQCVQAGQSRGVLRFVMPGTGFLWSHISQQGQNFRMNFMGYNLDVNPFIP